MWWFSDLEAGAINNWGELHFQWLKLGHHHQTDKLFSSENFFLINIQSTRSLNVFTTIITLNPVH